MEINKTEMIIAIIILTTTAIIAIKLLRDIRNGRGEKKVNANEDNKYLTGQGQQKIDLKILQQEELENRIDLQNRLKILITMIDILLVPATIATIIFMISILGEVLKSWA